jgi:hypothetical protein
MTFPPDQDDETPGFQTPRQVYKFGDLFRALSGGGDEDARTLPGTIEDEKEQKRREKELKRQEELAELEISNFSPPDPMDKFDSFQDYLDHEVKEGYLIAVPVRDDDGIHRGKITYQVPKSEGKFGRVLDLLWDAAFKPFLTFAEARTAGAAKVGRTIDKVINEIRFGDIEGYKGDSSKLGFPALAEARTKMGEPAWERLTGKPFGGPDYSGFEGGFAKQIETPFRISPTDFGEGQFSDLIQTDVEVSKPENLPSEVVWQEPDVQAVQAEGSESAYPSIPLLAHGGEVVDNLPDFLEPTRPSPPSRREEQFDFPDIDLEQYNQFSTTTGPQTFKQLLPFIVREVVRALKGEKEVPEFLKKEAEDDRKISQFLGLYPEEGEDYKHPEAEDYKSTIPRPVEPDTEISKFFGDRPGGGPGGFLSAAPTDVTVSELPAIMDEPGDISTKAGRSAFMEFLYDLFNKKSTPLPLGDEFIPIEEQIEQREAVDPTTGRDPLDPVSEKAVTGDERNRFLRFLEELFKTRSTPLPLGDEFIPIEEQKLKYKDVQNKSHGGPIEQPTLVNEPGAAPPSERADDVPMQLDKGDFVLPAKTVELTGIEDINTKLEKATKSAINNGEQLSQETIGKTGTIPVNVHNGEIIVPQQLVPHIGKESLEKMKNRGLEAQREEEQQEQQQNPLGQQQNPLGNPGAAGVAQMGQAIGLATGGLIPALQNGGPVNPVSGDVENEAITGPPSSLTNIPVQSAYEAPQTVQTPNVTGSDLLNEESRKFGETWRRIYQTTESMADAMDRLQAYQDGKRRPTGAKENVWGVDIVKTMDSAVKVFGEDKIYPGQEYSPVWGKDAIIDTISRIGGIETGYTTKYQKERYPGGPAGEGRSWYQLGVDTVKDLLTNSKILFGEKFEEEFSRYSIPSSKELPQGRSARESLAILGDDRLKQILVDDDALAATLAMGKWIAGQQNERRPAQNGPQIDSGKDTLIN